MSTPNDGGPAYPQLCGSDTVGTNEGMTLRDWFAGQALAGYRAHSMLQDRETIAEWAYGDADAFLKEREK